MKSGDDTQKSDAKDSKKSESKDVKKIEPSNKPDIKEDLPSLPDIQKFVIALRHKHTTPEKTLSHLKKTKREVSQLVRKEGDVLLKCRLCHNIFRSMSNFVYHKRSYCLYKFQEIVPIALEAIKKGQNGQKPETEIKEHAKKAFEINPRITIPKDIFKIIRNISESKKFAPSTSDPVVLKAVQNTEYALFNYVEDGPKSAKIDEDGFIEGFEKPKITKKEKESPGYCQHCNKDFLTLKILTDHLVMEHSQRTCYQCPCCDKTFSNTWGVHRHLYRAHKKSNEQIRKLRNDIVKKGISTDDGNRKKSIEPDTPSSSQDPEEEMDWVAELSGDSNTHICTSCGRRFERKVAMISHMNACKRKGGLNKDMKHTNAQNCPKKLEKPVEKDKCLNCEESFVNKYDFWNHLESCKVDRYKENGKEESVGEGDIKCATCGEVYESKIDHICTDSTDRLLRSARNKRTRSFDKDVVIPEKKQKIEKDVKINGICERKLKPSIDDLLYKLQKKKIEKVSRRKNVPRKLSNDGNGKNLDVINDKVESDVEEITDIAVVRVDTDEDNIDYETEEDIEDVIEVEPPSSPEIIEGSDCESQQDNQSDSDSEIEFYAVDDEESDKSITKKIMSFIKDKTCLVCSKTFKKLSSVRSHIAEHFNINNYKCLVNCCEFKCYLYQDMMNHLTNHGKEPKLGEFVQQLRPHISDFNKSNLDTKITEKTPDKNLLSPAYHSADSDTEESPNKDVSTEKLKEIMMQVIF